VDETNVADTGKKAAAVNDNTGSLPSLQRIAAGHRWKKVSARW